MLFAAVLFAWGVKSAGVAAAAGPAGAGRDFAVESLVFDVRKIVEIQQSSGWKIDRYEYEKMMPDTLLSVCRTTEETRSLALALLRREITRLDGPLEEALKKNENKIDDLKPLLF